MGKIKRVRQKLHQEAVKIGNVNDTTSLKLQNNLEKVPALPLNIQGAAKSESKTAAAKTKDAKVFNFPKGIFAGTVIPPEALVQTLKVTEPSADPPSVDQQHRGVGEKKRQQSKKEKMKERQQRWMNKISAIKQARQQQAELARRKATPVVGDMRSLVDALPELGSLMKEPVFKKQRGLVKKKAEPTDYCQMKPAQKRKLLETEISHFSQTMKDSGFKANPLAAIGEHLRKRLKQEDEQS